MNLSIARAADVLLGGGVVAYPTEGVFGLGCLPDDPDAVIRVLRIKKRDPAKGLILIAAQPEQLQDWIDVDVHSIPEPDVERPTTWIAPAANGVPGLITGSHAGVAVRLTTHPVAVALCEAVDSPIVSTSANAAGRPVARNQFVLRRQFAGCVDYIVPGDCGPSSGPSEIRNLESGETLRPRRS